ncbi:MAG TPA: hypothetical protein VFT53_01390 [Candidatus Saccharimonadales bacterium]|nr:hypothetical protein [Candidatus Saccharimonadales bacterium]
MNHLVIYNKKLFARDYINLMLTGNKVLGSKFTSRRTAPYQKLKSGDYLYLKESSGPVLGRVRAKVVISKEIVNPEEIMEFLTKYRQDIGINSDESLMNIWRRNSNKRYLCYWTVESPEVVQCPVFIHKRDRRTWVVGFEPSEELLAAFL